MSTNHSIDAIAPAQTKDSVALIIQHQVRADSIARYEQWLKVITAKSAEYPGHQGLQVIRPSAGHNEYSIIVHFATLADAERWTSSSDRQRLINEIADVFEHEDRFHIHPGIEFWFTPPSSSQRQARPWKQWLITTSVIWPLTMLVPPIFKPLFSAVPLLGHWGISHAIISSTMVALVVFVIMPRYVRLVSGWLFR